MNRRSFLLSSTSVASDCVFGGFAPQAPYRLSEVIRNDRGQIPKTVVLPKRLIEELTEERLREITRTCWDNGGTPQYILPWGSIGRKFQEAESPVIMAKMGIDT